jgi:copper oxidase (laccase) domain-containing protein
MIECGSRPEGIFAAVGPCISSNSYETDDDFRNNFEDGNDCFRIINERLHFDLPKYCKNRLKKTGISESNIDISGIDTYSDPENYFSYRFAIKNTKEICGRNISAVCLRK